jgi:two-component system response regulator AtoC
LLESELFGHVRGAYTGAVGPSQGVFVEAHQGTIFLDEIGDVTPALQAKLLRVLQEQQVRPVGGTTWRSVDVRVIAATNRDLEVAVAEGHFREDLYYRLRVVTISVPPLRERPDDIPLLVGHLARRAAASVGKEFGGLSEGALELLQEYRWPGNVRELSHVLERAVALARHPVLGVEDFLPLRPRTTPPVAPGSMSEGGSDHATLDELKRRHIRRVLEESQGNVSRAARVLGIERRSLYRMLRRYAIAHRGDRPD